MVSVCRVARIGILATLGLAASVLQVSASHLAYGTMNWRSDPSFVHPTDLRVQVTVDIGVEGSATTNLQVGDPLPMSVSTGSVSVFRADGVLSNASAPSFTVKSISGTETLVVATATVTLTLPRNQFPLLVRHQACCRVELREGNRETPFKMEVVIDPSRADRSPVVTLPPVVRLTQFTGTTQAAVTIPAPAPYRETGRVAFAPSSESGLFTAVPVGSIQCTNAGCPPGAPETMQLSPDGIVIWSPQTVGDYAVQFRLSSVDEFGVQRASIPVELRFKVVPPCPPLPGLTCRPNPVFPAPTPPYFVKAGESVTASVSASVPAFGTMTLSSVMLPGNATFLQTGATSSSSSSASGAMSWTPTLADVGRQFACFQAHAVVSSVTTASVGLSCAAIDVFRDLNVTFDSKGGTAVTSQTVAPGATATMPSAPARDSYIFVGWTLEPSASPAVASLFDFSTPLPRDITLYAVWSVPVTATYYSDGALYASHEGPRYHWQAPELIPGKAGHEFGGWYSDLALTTPFNFSTVLSNNVSLYAKWIAWVVASFSSEGTTFSTVTGPAPIRISPPSPDPVRDGYVFRGWYSDAALTTPFDFNTDLFASVILYAKWTLVPYTFTGFFSPVDNFPMVNVGQAGRTFPIKWRLARANGTPVTDLTSFVSFAVGIVACDGSPDNVLEEQLPDSVGGGVRYDAVADQFIYNWKTAKGSKGCRLVTITFNDGTVQLARFKLQ